MSIRSLAVEKMLLSQTHMPNMFTKLKSCSCEQRIYSALFGRQDYKSVIFVSCCCPICAHRLSPLAWLIARVTSSSGRAYLSRLRAHIATRKYSASDGRAELQKKQNVAHAKA